MRVKGGYRHASLLAACVPIVRVARAEGGDGVEVEAELLSGHLVAPALVSYIYYSRHCLFFTIDSWWRHSKIDTIDSVC